MNQGSVVLVKRNDRDGDRIPLSYRMYIADKTYLYKARIIDLCPDKAYFRVQPLPPTADISSAPVYTRKGYKSKTYILP
jgi:hypothetical protein